MDASCVDVLEKYQDDDNNLYKYISDYLLMGENKFNTKYKFTHFQLNSLKEDIKKLDECFEKTDKTSDDSMILYRGVKKNLHVNKEGDSIELKNFTSTSKNISRIKDFINDDTKCCIYRLHIEKDIPYIDMTKLPESPYIMEEEVLLPRNLIMTYISDDRVDASKIYKYMKKRTLLVRNVKISKKEGNTTVKTKSQNQDNIINKDTAIIGSKSRKRKNKNNAIVISNSLSLNRENRKINRTTKKKHLTIGGTNKSHVTHLHI